METHYKEIETTSFNSDIHNISIAESFIDTVCNDLLIDEDNYGNILIAVTEAVNNAMQHGNRMDQSKLIQISAFSNSDELRFVIKDQGIGFDFNSLPDPTAPENIEKETGRGVFLMRSLADEVVFEDNGSKVTLIFSLQK
ncbi:MAG: ATP-binding protein [Brumimicrobium sp.]|nr:ATP-binding protein [Brumimicrobium sp.]MCO5267378.1 ATP-binding protein [Brumimicrobium sp.]